MPCSAVRTADVAQ